MMLEVQYTVYVALCDVSTVRLKVDMYYMIVLSLGVVIFGQTVSGLE